MLLVIYSLRGGHAHKHTYLHELFLDVFILFVSYFEYAYCIELMVLK